MNFKTEANDDVTDSKRRSLMAGGAEPVPRPSGVAAGFLNEFLA